MTFIRGFNSPNESFMLFAQPDSISDIVELMAKTVNHHPYQAR